MATSPLSENFPSPNAIPPRSSSYGAASFGKPHVPQKSVLRPKPEAEWISRSRNGSKSTIHSEDRRVQFKTLTGMAAQPTLVEVRDSTSRRASAVAAEQTNGTDHIPSAALMTALNAIPPLPPSKDSSRRSSVELLPTWTPQKESVLLAPYTYLENHPGKDIRSQLIVAFNAWLQVPQASLDVITRVVGMLHTASLLIDDVEDNSILRRGVPVAHSIFGTAQTINSANYVYFLALQDLAKLQNQECNNIFVQELLNLHRGQGMDLFWRDTLTCPSEADYLEMVGNKTGGLIRLAVKLMMAESSLARTGKVPNCVPLVSTVGLLFQVLDDYLNLQSTAYTERKGLCEDLTEGKFSFPVIHAIRSASESQQNHQAHSHSSPATKGINGVSATNGHHYPSAISQPPPYTNNILLNILSQRTQDNEVKRYAVRYMEQCGSFAYTRKVVTELRAEALKLVDEVATAVGGTEGNAGKEGLRMILDRLKAE